MISTWRRNEKARRRNWQAYRPLEAWRRSPRSNYPAFASETFTKILRAVRSQPRRPKIYEKGGTLRLSVNDVKNIQQAKAALEGVVPKEMQA